MRALRFGEYASWLIGLVLLVSYAALRADQAVSANLSVERFERARQEQVDTSLWSVGRIEAWRKSLEDDPSMPLAVLSVPRVGIVAPVLEGTDESTLDRGVGRIPGTAFPGEPGNLAIAGHRDGFFRALKDVSTGDTIEILTLDGTAIYRIEKTEIVEPSQVEVLEPTEQPSVTLVTCYPFYHVGHAPKRFIVRAVLTKERER